jgi:hypothetical protein
VPSSSQLSSPPPVTTSNIAMSVVIHYNKNELNNPPTELQMLMCDLRYSGMLPKVDW